MALNVTQVNQAFLGLLGRPATGAEAAKFAGLLDAATLAQTLLTDASFKTQLSLEAPSFKTVDLLNTDPAAFVESLYTALLGRASDAEGKAFWLSVAGATPNRADVVSQFIAAVQSQEGSADANAFATIQAEDKALASAWVESLYNNLAGRASDAEGLDFWTNAIVSFAMTPAQVAASFAAALALQGNTTEDGQNYLAKQGVADNFTANFKDFGTLITANEKTKVLNNLVTMMNGVNKDSQVEQYTEEITKVGNEYQNIAAVQFTKADDDDLGIDPETGESNLKGAANFTGTYNLTDAAKGTIQSSDSATGTEAYLTDTLTINVTGYDKTTHDTFNLSELPSTTSIEKLSINNGAATVSGSISGDFEYINVNGTGSFNIDATTSNADGFKDIVLNSATDKDGLNTFSTNDNVRSIKTGAGNDTLNLGTVTKSLSTGAGDDIVTASLAKGATADLGAGNDTFNGNLDEAAKLSAGAGNDELNITTVKYREDKKGNPIAEVEIDGGTGEDTLDLSLVSNGTLLGDGQGIKSIKGIENLKVGVATKLMASAVSGQKLELSGNSLELNASGANSVDLTKFANAKDQDVKVSITNVKSGTINLATSTKEFNAISETIVLDKDASGVSIKGFEKANDKISIAGAVNSGENLFAKDAQGDVIAFTANLKANYIYKVDLKDPMTLKALKDLKDTGLSEKDVFYVIATDELNGKNSTAKIYKIEVGKDLKVGKLDQMATVNVADKAQLSYKDFGAGTPTPTPTPTPVPTPTVEVDLSTRPAAPDGSVTVLASDFAGYDANAAIKVDLPATAKKVNLDGVNVKAVEVSGLQANAEVVIGSGSVIDTLSSTENVALKYTVAAGAKVGTIIGRDQNDTIDTSAAAAGSITGTINGGAGNDTLIISGDGLSNLTSLQSIEKIVVSGTSISAKALSGVTTTLSTNKATGATLEVKATAADTNINLANLVQDTADSGSVSLNITGVASNAKVALGTADTLETVNIAGNNNVTVTNAKAGDVISSTYFAGITGGGANGSFAELGTTIEAGKAYFTSNTTVTDAASAAAALSAQLATITSGNAIVAVNNGANAYVFAVNGAAANKLTLLAKVDNTISADDTINNGVVTFDAGNTPVPPVPTDAYDFNKDLVDGNITVGTTKDIRDNVIDFKADGSLSITNVGGDLNIKAQNATAANKINLFMGQLDDTINYTIKSEAAATTTLTLAKDTTLVSGAGELINIDTLVINGNTTLSADALAGLKKSAATISQTNSTDTVTVNEEASFEGIKGSANINAVITNAEFVVKKGTDYTGNLNVTLGNDRTNNVRVNEATTLANADSIKSYESLTTLNLSADAVSKLKTGVKVDLSASDTEVRLTGYEAKANINLADKIIANDGDKVNHAAALTEIKTFVGSAGDDSFTINTIGVKSIDGGAGEDTITLSGNDSGAYSSLTSITNVEKLVLDNSAAIKLNAAALNGSNAEIKISNDTVSNKIITLDATKVTSLDLSSLTKAKGSAGDKLNITTKDGFTVKLSDAFKETVTFDNALKGAVNLGNLVQAATKDDAVVGTLAISATSLTGSDAKDTINLNGDYTKLTSIDLDKTLDTLNVSGKSTLLASAVDGIALKIANTNNSALTIDASNYGSINLSKLITGDGTSTSGALTVSGVESGKITLSAVSAYDTKETIVLGADASKVTITNISKGAASSAKDSVDAKLVGLTGAKETTPDANGIAANKVFIGTDVLNTAELIRAKLGSDKTAAVDSFVLSKTSGTEYQLYKVTEAITAGASGGAIDLIATLTINASGTATYNDGVISFS